MDEKDTKDTKDTKELEDINIDDYIIVENIGESDNKEE